MALPYLTRAPKPSAAWLSWGEEIVTPLVEPTDLELIRKIAAAGGRKYTAGNLDRGKYQRLVALGWLTGVSVNISDVVYEVTEAGKAAALRGD